ncbi:hypothetical protein FRC17_000484 [Serendipita sp. 399]|nr:hypothetical protein FRC17_000484 [Serendipita sp. 399]
MDEATPLDTQPEGQSGFGDSTNLFRVIDRDRVHGLNLTVPEDAKELIKSWDMREDATKFVDSGVDDQLIINVPFTQNVRVKSVLLKLGRGEFSPRRLRLYVNYPAGVGFDEAESVKPHLDIALLQGQDSVSEYPLRVSAFSNVFSMSLFFIGFKGDAREHTRDQNTRMEVPAENAPGSTLADSVTEKINSQLQIR